MKNILGTNSNIWISTNNEDLTNERLIYSFVHFEKSNKTCENFFYVNLKDPLRYSLERIKKDGEIVYVNKYKEIDKDKFKKIKKKLLKL
jgi:hypothetical protein